FLDPDRISAEKGKSNIQDVVDRLTGLPEASKKPIVTALESKQAPIIEVSVAGNIDELELRKAARFLESELEAVPGVARIAFRGLKKLEYHVEADLRKLSRYRLSLDDLAMALRSQNVMIPGGVIEVRDSEGKEKIVRTKGDFETLEDVQKTVVRANDLGEAIRVRDVARVFETQERASVLSRTNGLPAIVLTVLQKERTDAIDVVDGVKKRLEEIKPQINSAVKVNLINDFSDFIRRRLSIVTGNLLLGLLFVLLLLPLMIPWRFSLIVALGEPFAFLGTILLLYYTDHSINLISMVGLIIVSGILVDDSIVVTENAVRMVGEGKTPREAAIQGTMQIMAPVTASVLTTTMAFLPMAFMSGIFGKFVREIPIAVLAALGVSLFETFFILPAHVAHWIKPKSFIPAATAKKSVFSGLAKFAERTQNLWDKTVTPKYLSWLQWSIDRKYKMMTGLLLFFVLSIAVGVKVMKFVLFPPDGIEIFYIQTEAPIGTSLENHAAIVREIEQKVSELPASELLDHTTTVGLVQQDPNDPNTQRGAEFAQVMVLLTPESARNRKAEEIIEDMRGKIGTPRGLDRVAMTRVNSGPPVGKAISIGVRGKEYKDIMVAVSEIEKYLSTMTGVFDVRNTYRMGKEEVRIQVNGAEAAAAGLSVAQIGTSVRAAFEGNVATSIRKLDEEI
ncbi:MAG: efflux RND transporter permease subunit, partial [Bdellovibrionales bacterium]|nr:efflux RND transporter permease subunit [Bdellovibrionales bacterium]